MATFPLSQKSTASRGVKNSPGGCIVAILKYTFSCFSLNSYAHLVGTKSRITEGLSFGSSGIIFSEDSPLLALYFYLDCITVEASKRSSIQGILNNSGYEVWVQCELYIA
jgi:hypothetical protein